jgi:alpha-1,6-mannosyltransferase
VATPGMSGDATTLPLRDDPLGGPVARLRRGLPRWRAGALTGAEVRVRAGAVALLTIVSLCVLIVLMAANRPSLLSPPTHANFFPGWMAGPLGGLWPGLTRNSTTQKDVFTGAIVVMYGAYIVCFKYAPKLPVRWVLAAIAAVHAILLIAPPLALTDVFNYVNYGRMEIVHHLNPYTTIPILEPHNDPSFILSNWHQLLSPYGPLFTLLTFAVVPLGVAGSFWALKCVLAAASLGTLLLVWKCARLLGRDPARAVAFVGLNPIVLVWGLGGDHNDFLMLFAIMLGFYLLLLARSRAAASELAGAPAHAGALRRALWLHAPEAGAGAAFVTAAGIKASAALLLPVVLVSMLRRPRTLLNVALGMGAAVAIVGAVSLVAFGLHIPDLSTQSRLVTNESVPNLVGLAVGAGGESETVRAVMSGLLAASILLCCWSVWRRRAPSGDAPGGEGERLFTASAWANVALLVTLSWVLPWYVFWALPLAALSRSRRLRVAVLVLGAYLIVAWSPASGLLWNALNFHPERTALGRLHQRYVKELLN